MLNYCLVRDGFAPRMDIGAGLACWARVFEGEIIDAEKVLKKQQMHIYDIIHIIFCPSNYDLIRTVRGAISGKNSGRARLILTLDRAFFDPKVPAASATLREIHAHADLVFSHDHATASYFEQLMGRPVHELPMPSDLGGLEDMTQKDKRVALLIAPTRFTTLRALASKSLGLWFRLRHGIKVETIMVPPKQCPSFLQKLQRFEFICVDPALSEYHEELLYLTAKGCILMGGTKTDVIRRCFPICAHVDFRKIMRTFSWLVQNKDAKAYVAEYARDRLEYHNLENSGERLIALLNANRRTNSPAMAWECHPRGQARIVFWQEIHHAYGPSRVTYCSDEFIVVCLVKNGAEYLPSFLRHYRLLGARHFIFIDNGSTDGSIEMFKQQPDVTLYSTTLSHRNYESEIRRVVIERHCRARWCLSVDIDELFEFPAAPGMPMHTLLAYLGENGFTSVVAYMLDMFAVTTPTPTGYLEDIYTYFDVSYVQRSDYFEGYEAFCNYNYLSAPGIGNYHGGIRQQYIHASESRFLLTKHPLIFIDHHIEPVSMPHFCNKSRVADITCLLKHYKLTDSLRSRIEQGIANDAFSYIIKDQITAYLAMTDRRHSNSLNCHPQLYTDVQQLVDNKFLYISENYKHFCGRYRERLKHEEHS